jgi:hypothetical protein
MKESLSEFNEFRSEMNEEIHASDHLGMKRFLALDHQAYQDGALTGENERAAGVGGVGGTALRRLHHLPSGAVRRGGLETGRSD